MEKSLLGYCGMGCGECPVYIATKNNDNEMRVQTAAYFSKKFGAEIKPEHINCSGCVAGTVNGTILFGHCQSCQVRLSAKSRGVQSCTECSDYACATLKEAWDHLPPEAKKNSEQLKKI